ncbi:MAG: flagellar filament capping protein FliD [Selenomonas sp.]|uniref:flagellar filament capping protein FliD n=1 Tax=Selenomonas sp. TaxID=2053611 RepID=UPI0025E20BF4|nr:flagellar filament capping protein FliD [Selenomonas sp.]MCI6087044.1 flagellar filament capping protein FliD [Selenomonas sp.]MDY4416393.1 flagellar filament capping protein FliD [Selenomonas sp.]
MSTSGIYGLSGSGIDVDSMVKVGMLTKQNQYDKMYKEEVKNEWKKEAYSDLYSSVNSFNQTTLSNYKMSSTTSPMTATSSSEGTATATANADAASMSHTVTVTSLATNAYLQTGNAGITRAASTSTEKSTSIYLKDILYSASDLATQQEAYDKMSDEEKQKAALEFTISDGDESGNTTRTISFTYEELFGTGSTLNDLASKIKNSGVNIQATYDSVNDSFSLYQKTGGAANKITLSTANEDGDATGDAAVRAQTLLTNLSLSQVDSTTQTLGTALTFDTTNATQSASGTDGSVTIDGKTYATTSQKLTVNNVSYTIGAKGTTTVTVAQDTDKLVENVKKFVEDYNKMIDALNTKYYETQYSDYGVLTKSQENGMSQEQITKWNEKAKSGLLYHDAQLGKIISSMREALYTPVEDTGSDYNTMMSLGISSSTDQGHITLDETKLKKAIAADPNAVRSVFAASGDVTNKDGTTSTDYNKEGVMNRISDALYANLKTLKSYAGDSSETADGSTLGTLIENLKTKMSDFKVQMTAYENLLYDKYDAMETAIQRLGVQMGYITGGN